MTPAQPPAAVLTFSSQSTLGDNQKQVARPVAVRWQSLFLGSKNKVEFSPTV